MGRIARVVCGIVVVICMSGIIVSSQAQPAKEADWQSDWAKFVEAFNACLKSSGCDVEKTFKDKTVTWSGTFRSLHTNNSPIVTMVPASPPFVDSKGQTGALSCCNLDTVVDFESWKALAPGTLVTFTAIVGKDFVPVVMMRGIGSVILREGKLATKKNP